MSEKQEQKNEDIREFVTVSTATGKSEAKRS